MVKGKHLQIEVVKAMGLPIDGCQGVELDTPIDGVCTVTVTYYLKPEWLQAVSRGLQDADALPMR